MRKWATAALGGALLLAATGGQALLLELELTLASPQPATLSQEIFVRIGVESGLGDDAAPSVGAYELDVSYDPSKLSFLDAVFGDSACTPRVGDTCLGNLADAEVVLAGPDDDGLGLVELGAASLLSPEALTVGEPSPLLNEGQPGSFVIATLRFQVVAELGPTTVNAPQALFVDENGLEFPQTTVSPAFVQIVPEPSSALLLLAGIASLAASRREA